MRVLFFCPQFAPVIGGAERQAERLGKALVARGVEVCVMTPRLESSSPTQEDLDGLRVRRFRLQDLAARAGWRRGIGLINAPWIVVQIVAALWHEVGRADIVHCHIGSLQSIAAALAARLRGRPVICKAAMADASSDLGEMARNGVMSRLLAGLGRTLFNRWVATTEAVSQALQRFGVDSARISVIPNGVDLEPLADRWRPRPVRRFLYLGRISTNADRDVPTLLLAFDELAGQFADVELAIVGSGDLFGRTRELARASSYAGRIQMPGDGDSRQWLAWADCLVLPSRREGLSNALLEAMAVGLPCIANDIPPNREVLAGGRAGELVPVGEVARLAATMALIATDEARAASLSSAAVDRICERYSLDSVAEQCLSLYGQLLVER